MYEYCSPCVRYAVWVFAPRLLMDTAKKGSLTSSLRYMLCVARADSALGFVT